MKSKPTRFLPLLPIIALTVAQSATAETGTWTGAFNGIWNTSDTNWSGLTTTDPWDNVNGPDNIAVFNTASLAAVVAGPVFANGLTFDLSGDLSASTINLVGFSPFISVANGQSASISSVIAGTDGLVKSGVGTLTLFNSTHSGGTAVNEGRLILDNTMTGSADFTTDAELEFHLGTGNQSAIGGIFGGTGKLIKTGASSLTLSDWTGNQTVALTGADSLIEVQAGTLGNFTAAGAFGPIVDWSSNEAGLTVASGAIFDINNNSVNVDELNGSGTILKDSWDTPVTLTIGVLDGSGTFSGAISQTAATLELIKLGSGTQTLSGANTYTGGTTVAGGRLILESSATSGANFATDAELEFHFTSGDKPFLGGTFSGTGKLIKTGVGSLTLSDWAGNQTVALTGADSLIEVQAGTLGNFTAAGAFGPTIVNWSGNQAGLTVASGAIFDIKNNNVTVDELNGSGTILKDSWDTPVTLTIGVLNGSGTFSGAISQTAATLELIKQGSGSQTLSGPNTYTGGTTISGGTLALGAHNTLAASPLSIENATLDAGTFTNTFASLAVTGAATIHLGTGATLVFADSNTVDWTGGTLNIAGTFVSGSSIKFTTSGGLTAGQLNAISFNGSGAGTATLDANGYLVMGSGDPFTAWAGSGVNFNDDANSDGVSNGMAWLLGAADKDANATGLLPKVAHVGGALKLTFTSLKTANRGGTAFKLQYSRDLGITDFWSAHEVIVPDTATTVGAVTFIVPSANPDPDLVNLEATIPASAAAPGTRLFARLSANP